MQVKDGSKYDKTEKIDWANNAHKTEVELCTSSNDHETSRRQTAVSELLNRSTLSFNCLRCHQQLLSPTVYVAVLCIHAYVCFSYNVFRIFHLNTIFFVLSG